MNSTIQIAQVLNVSPNQIKSVREMAWVYCVVVIGQRATFVSKKKVEAVMVEKVLSVSLMESVGNRWQKNGMDRIYFDVAALVPDLSNSKKRKIAGGKLYFDLNTNGFFDSVNDSTIVKTAIAQVRERCSVAEAAAPTAKPYANAMMTSTGEWVSPDEWDEIEGDM
jgi:hypothetical protein